MLDTTAKWVITGQAPEILQSALALGQRLLTETVLKKVPGLGAITGAGGGKKHSSSKPTQAANGSGGGHNKRPPKVMNGHDVECFKKTAKGKPDEYDSQLADQEKGLNDLTVQEYLEGRERYKEIGRKGTGKEQAQAQVRQKYKKPEYQNTIRRRNTARCCRKTSHANSARQNENLGSPTQSRHDCWR